MKRHIGRAHGGLPINIGGKKNEHSSHDLGKQAQQVRRSLQFKQKIVQWFQVLKRFMVDRIVYCIYFILFIKFFNIFNYQILQKKFQVLLYYFIIILEGSHLFINIIFLLKSYLKDGLIKIKLNDTISFILDQKYYLEFNPFKLIF